MGSPSWNNSRTEPENEMLGANLCVKVTFLPRHNSLYNHGSPNEPVRSSYVSYSPVHSKPDLIVIFAVNGNSCELVPTEMV
jgi:hypothetical protein